MRWLIIALVSMAVVLCCCVRCANSWISQQEPSQIQAAIEMMRDNPTAAGKEKK